MPPRRSARIKVGDGETSQKQPLQYSEIDQNSHEPDPETEDLGYSSSSRKRQKRTKPKTSTSPVVPKVKGTRGKLRMLPEMPLDILYEIFGHLTPSDLLRLARTTKALRYILMRRSTISLWKQAFSNEPSLPACPPDLNEPQFANLLFGHHCHFCSRSNVRDVLWAYRVRSCGKCISERFLETSYHYTYLCPQSHLSRKGRSFSYVLASARENVQLEIMRLQDSPADLARFRLEREQLITQLQDHAKLCQRWQENLKHSRTLELSDNRVERRKAIFVKLIELGWNDELELLKTSRDYKLLRDHPFVKQSKNLTERTWNNIKGELVELLQTIKAARLKTEHIFDVGERMQTLVEITKQFYSTQATTEVLPVPADFCNMEPYRTIIMDASHELICTPQEHFSRMSDLSAVWLHNCNQFLLSLIPSNSALKATTKDDLAPLHLATTFFHCNHCNHCNRLIAYPRILKHQCITFGITRIDESAPEYAFLLGCRGIGSEPWNYGNNRIQFYYKASNSAKAILTACEMDPDMVTASEMDILDHRIECLDKLDEQEGLVMGWRAAISHDIEYHQGSMDRWRLIDECTVLEAKKKEAELQARHSRSNDIV